MGYIYESYKRIKRGRDDADEECVERENEKQDEEAMQTCVSSLQSLEGWY